MDMTAPEQHRDRPHAIRDVADELYVLVVAGITTGVLVVGIGSRLVMLVLRLSSPDHVRGVTSDDGFTIGRFTVAGTYNLLMIGALVGVFGAAAYQWVRPWLIGPRWLRLGTLALAAGAVVGSMLIHADGIDFRLLEPLWLAVMLFVALPALFAVCVSLAVDRVEAHAEHAAQTTWRRWILPALLAAAFPLVLIPLVIAAAVLVVWVRVRNEAVARRIAASTTVGVVARLAWFGIAVGGLVALLGDIADLRAIT